MNLYAGLEKHGQWKASRLFIRDLSKSRDYTYGDLETWTARIATRLQRDFGVQAGDRIAVQVEKSPQAFFLYLACIRMGAIYLPLNPAYQGEEIEYFLGDAEAKIFVCDPLRSAGFQKVCEKSRTTLLTLDSEGDGSLVESIDSIPFDFKTVDSSDSDVAALLYTSGTTGRSKGAMLSHANLKSNALALASCWGFTENDRLLHALPIFHVHGLFISMSCTLASGSSVLWMKKFEPSEVLRQLNEATVFMGVPTYYTRLIDSGALDRKSCTSIRLFVSGSAPLLTGTFDDFRSKTGHSILERYGMTETGVNSSNPLDGARVSGSVGQPLPGTEVRIDESTKVIEIRGPNVFLGYWKQPEKTRAEFQPDGFFKTGDMGEWDERGYLKIIGRAKDLVISGGFNVYPKEIELLLDEVPGVVESAVFGVPHPDFGEAVVATLVKSPSHEGQALEERAIIAAIRSRLAAFKVPKRIFFLDQLPKNTMGKVQKNLLRERFQKTFSQT